MHKKSLYLIYKITLKIFIIGIFLNTFSCTKTLEKISETENEYNNYRPPVLKPPVKYVPVQVPYHTPNSRAYSNPYKGQPSNYPKYYDYDQYYVPPSQYYYSGDQDQMKVMHPY